MKNHEMNPMKLLNVKKCFELEMYDLESTVELLGIKRLNEALRLKVKHDEHTINENKCSY